MSAVKSLLNSHKVIICAGSGGVGKTTMSAALALEGAREGKRVLVLTIDPAKRLATALGLQALSGDVVKVPEQSFRGELYAAVVDSKQVFDQFVAQHVQDENEKKLILNNRLYQQLSTTLSGSQEYTALEKLYQAYSSGQYDLIILDTPPAQHAIDFLRAPQKMYSLFQSSIVKWFLPQTAATSGWRSLFDKGTQTVFKTLENLTGADFLEELRHFFLVIKSLRQTVQDHSAEIQRVLTGASTAFVVVTSFDEVKIKEARVFQKALQTSGYHLGMVIINRAFPLWTLSGAEAEVEGSSAMVKLRQYYLDLRGYYSKQERAFSSFAAELEREVKVLRIPDFDQDIHELDQLAKVADELLIRG